MPTLPINTPSNSQQFVSRNGSLTTANDLNLTVDHSYSIDGVPVLSLNELGAGVTKSKLRQVGTLNSLSVSGDTQLGEFVFVNSSYNRVGIGTEEPNASFSIVDNNVEIILGSPDTNLATIGTYTPHDLGLVTDNVIRLTAKQNGEIHIGDPANKTGKLFVHGELTVDSIVSDIRITRLSPLEFMPSKDQSIYGLGLQWLGKDYTRQLVLRETPDRIWTTESFDIGENQSYFINGDIVLGANALGKNVVNSNLVTVGTLENLAVQGLTNLLSDLHVTNGVITAKEILFNDGSDSLAIDNTGIATSNKLTITTQGSEVFYADANQINIGDKANAKKPIKVLGPLSIGINNPDSSVNFAVAGDVRIGQKKFTNGSSAPTTGEFVQGDICWNTVPQSGSYVGWICVQNGAPGVWSPFGLIA